jgi:hypothetical protein
MLAPNPRSRDQMTVSAPMRSHLKWQLRDEERSCDLREEAEKRLVVLITDLGAFAYLDPCEAARCGRTALKSCTCPSTEPRSFANNFS